MNTRQTFLPSIETFDNIPTGKLKSTFTFQYLDLINFWSIVFFFYRFNKDIFKIFYYIWNFLIGKYNIKDEREDAIRNVDIKSLSEKQRY